MSVAAVAWAFEQALPPNEKVVLLALADCENGQSLACMPGQDFLAEKASMSVRTVQRMLIALEERGLIRRDRRTLETGQRTSDSYTLALRDNLSGGSPNTTTVSGGNTTTVSGTREPEDRTGSNTPIVPAWDDVEDNEPAALSPLEELIDDIWNAYPTARRSTRKMVRQKVTTIITTAKASERDGLASAIIESVRAHAERWATWPAKDRQYIPLLTTWLNQERWTSDALPEARGNGVPQTELVGRDGLPAPYGVTPNGRRIGPPPRMGEHPRSPYLGDRWLAAASGETLISRLNPSVYREPTDHERRILRGETDD